MKLYIVRHGETEENRLHILQGHLPGTLTLQGIEQVHKTAEYLLSQKILFSRIVSSDLKRAMDSAQILAENLNLPIIPMKMLRERDWGKYTGITIAEAKEKYFKEGKWNFPDSAETDEEIYQRAQSVLMYLKENYNDEVILLVTHGQFARNLFGAYQGCSYKEVSSFSNAEVRIMEI